MIWCHSGRKISREGARLTCGYQQLSTLVDLKQKQNNMIDARTARLQAEQSHLMTLEAEKQGRTLMVFTIVTIVFVSLLQSLPTTRMGDGGSWEMDKC